MSITPTRAAAWTVALLAALLMAASAAYAAGRLPIVSTMHSARLHGTILVNRSGHTLYNLSVERRGRFICTNSACVSLWHPLIVAKGVKPAGSVPLGTIMRPDGRMQVTYKGAPLYTFVQDLKSGQTNGEGFKDVGVWHATTVGARAAAAPQPKPSSGGYGY
jgi:predicted lipoprotein with Yx(FWY)xxD motif